VMLRRDGYVMVLDFGLAKLTEQQSVDVAAESTTLVGMNTDTGVMGTVGYMSPEQAQGMSVDRRTDIFSLGVVIYEMVTGRVPFETKSPGDVIVPIPEQEPTPLAHYFSEAPAELQVIVNKALRRNREERYQTITKFLIDLKSVRSGPSKKSGLVARRLGLLIAALALMTAVAVWQRFARTPAGNAPRTDSLGRSAAMKTTPLTDLPGMEGDPAFSPDENEIAFGWTGEANDNVDIYVKPLDGGNLRRLTTNPALDSGPVWSPDGHSIAFIRYSDKERAIFTIPSIGGSEFKLFSANVLGLPDGRAYIDWSPDGKSLVYSDASASNRPFGIFQFSAETLERQQLTSAPEHWVGDQRPVYSPTGQMLAFVRVVSVGANAVGDIYVMPATGGDPKRLTFDNQNIEGLSWTPEGRNIVFSSNRGGLSGLWQISATGGEPQPLGIGGDNALLPAISNLGRLLAYVKHFQTMSIWRVDLQSSFAETGAQTRVLSTTTQNYFPKISPDGKRIVFSSSRSGAAEIWACDADGLNMLQLTRLGRPETGSPRWSPDGRFIAFDTRLKEPSDIYVIGSDGGPSRRLTEDPAEDVLPSWSQDGRSIYFGSDRSGDFQVWKVPAEGGAALQVTQHGGFEAFESPDGKYVYYVKRGAIGLWRVPTEGGKETRVLDYCAWSRWSVADKGIYFARPGEKASWVLEFFSFATRRLTRVAALDKEPAGGLGVCPDGRWLVYAQTDSRGMNIMLVENFR
jgi:Tol biopolymer transport system component